MSDADRAPRAWPPLVGGFALLALFALKLVADDDRHGHGKSLLSLCENEWDAYWPLMGMAELAAGVTTLIPATRRQGSFVGLLAMIVAAALSIYAGVARIPMKGCRCLGPFDAPWWVHFLVAAAVAVPLAMTLSDERARRPFVRRARAESAAGPRATDP